MRRLATVTAVALALALSACGGVEQTVATPSASGPPSSDPPASAPSCSVLPTLVPATGQVSADLATKPVVAPQPGTPPTDVTVSDIVVGEGEQAAAGDMVAVKYVGAIFSTGMEFDSSWTRGPEETIDFGLCQEGVVAGFAIGPIGMKIGGRRSITIPPRFGYGATGQPQAGIGPTDTLVFIVDLVRIEA